MDDNTEKNSPCENDPDPNVTALEELQSLLFARERMRIDRLEKRLDSPEIFVNDVERVLPEAVRLRTSHNDDLTRMLEPNIEEGLRSSIKKDPDALADVLFPIMGPAIRKAIVSILLSMTQSVNKVVEHSFSIRGIKWRLEALKAQKTFAEIVLLKTLKYQVEQIFLIHKETGLVLQHVVVDDIISQDPDLVSGMLTAIQDFISDSFSSETREELDTLRIGGDRTVWIDRSSQVLLASVIRGTPPLELRSVFHELVNDINRQEASSIDSFDGDVTPFARVNDQLRSCLVFETKEKKHRYSPVLPALLACLIFGVTFWSFNTYRDHSRWTSYLQLLNETPGIVVTSSQKKSGRYLIYGLIDPLAPDPGDLLKDAKLAHDSVSFHWKPYISLHRSFFALRAHNILKPPESVALEIKNDTLYARGATFRKWIEQARQKASSLPSITHYNDEKVVDIKAALKPPQSVDLKVIDDTLYAQGTAFKKWIKQARQKAAAFSGINHFNDAKVVAVETVLRPPNSVTLKIEGNVLYFQGTASQKWLEQARKKIAFLPGIANYNDKGVIDIGAELNPPETVTLKAVDGTLYAQGSAFSHWIKKARQKIASLATSTKYNDTEVVSIGNVLKPPKSISLKIKKTTLYAQGSAFRTWVEKARVKTASLPGITHYNDKAVTATDVVLNPPETVILTLKNRVLHARGSALNKWINKARQEAASLTGIDRYNDIEVINIDTLLTPPKSITLKIKNTILYARGSAFRAWIEKARQKAVSVPEITQYDDSAVTEIDRTLNPPSTVILTLKNRVLHARGLAFGKWIGKARQKAASLTGLAHYNDTEVINVENVLTPPQSVTLEISNGTLYIRGMALKEWLRTVRHKASSLPGITNYNDEKVVDINDLNQLKTSIQKQLFYCEPSNSAIVKGQKPKLRKLLGELEDLHKMARIMNKVVHIEITGHTDSPGWSDSIHKLCRKRAEYFFALLVSLGLDTDKFIVKCVSAEPSSEKFRKQRTVTLKVDIL